MRILSSVIILMLLVGCQQQPVSPPVASAIPTPASTSPTSTSTALPDTSLYHLSSPWQDQDGKDLHLADLKGQVQVMALVYTSCQGACPRLVEDMKAMEKQLPQGKVGFLLVSIDPDVDTCEQLGCFAKDHQLGPAWRLLRGKPEDVRELAAAVSFKYKKAGDKDFAHSDLITILSPTGEIAHQQVGLQVDPTLSLEAIRKFL